MLRVALTGGIATGKSYVLVRLRDRGVATIDADELVHMSLRPGTETATAVAAEFGGNVVNPDGSIDRAKLGARVFADPDARRRLEVLIHPSVYAAIDKWFATLDGPFGVASIPLLYETHHEADFAVIVATHCSVAQQVQRIVERDGLSRDEATQRIDAQLPSEEKARRAHYVIDTGGTLSETDDQVDDLLASLRTRA